MDTLNNLKNFSLLVFFQVLLVLPGIESRGISMFAIIRMDPDPLSGLTSGNLAQTCIDFFKNELGVEV